MSERLPWFRCFPSALLGALAGLDPDEGLVYVTALLRIYETGGPVAETARTLGRRTGLNERKAGAALERLFEAGKLALLSSGKLDSPSTHAEIEWQRDRHDEQAAAGRASAAKRQKQGVDKKNDASGKTLDAGDGQKTQQNQQIGSTGVERPFNHLEEDTDTQVQATPSPEPRAGTRSRSGFPSNAFDLWYEHWPNKVGKDAARRRFETIRKSGRVSFAELVEGVERYKATKPPTRDWCNPATWLNEGRWADVPAVQPIRDGPLGKRLSGPTAAALARRSTQDRSDDPALDLAPAPVLRPFPSRRDPPVADPAGRGDDPDDGDPGNHPDRWGPALGLSVRRLHG